ncbi:nocobactin polyketide synthase NbtC [Nocardia huaxiensis]|uniref:Nocobactin polyketide synthase NbtC n=1 Tax=Nocardia huaxiensis TaxID=2755382 RepID=A0A7D6VCG7_9NOCA|nr:nocobactin polyketide synthase NbtC [Nocardia huaxiensis]QLY31811.1 nocobactin polyketide synthase NbtC [Nocardia huaxiensis]
MSNYRLPDGSIPVLLSSDTADGLRAEATNILAYVQDRPRVTAERLADHLLRTRSPRRYRALILAAADAVDSETTTARAELLAALQAVADGKPHPAVVASDGPAAVRRVGFVFPGQGSQRPGMGKLYYEISEAYRARVDECAAVHRERFGHDQPLHYLLGDEGQYQDTVWEVQPALMFHMTGLAAMWQAAGVDPAAVIGHSQGELAAGAVSGVMSLRDAVLVVTHRARLVERISPRGYSMAVLAMNREDTEALLARHSGWAELSVVNAPHIMAISGDRDTIKDMVATATERGQFAREIGVAYPAHTSIVAEVRADFEGFLGNEMSGPTFQSSDIACYGATLGEAITPDLEHEQYWYWNLRNRVRFDRAIVSAATAGIDTLIEVVEHPVLQLAIQENLTLVPRDPARGSRDFRVLGTSLRTADSLRDFTRNLAAVAVHDLNYRWEALRVDMTTALPLRDFPHTVTNPRKLWAAGGYEPSALVPPAPAVPKPQRLVEKWIPQAKRSMVAPRTFAFVDLSGECADLAAALVAAADRHGATATILDAAASPASSGAANPEAPQAQYDTVVILLPALPETDGAGAVPALTEFFAERAWLPAVSGLRPGGECWLVTVGGELVTERDALPQYFHGGVSAGFRSAGVEYPGLMFRHLDLAADAGAAQAVRIMGALHTAGEAELALRDGKVFVKRLVADESEAGAPADLDHVLIVGGTGQLGLRFCEHFAHAGAGRITLLSRSGETAATAGELARLRNVGGVEIVVAACDVNDPEAVARFAAAQSERPVSLLIHAAVNYVDAELADITSEMVATAAASKILGLDAVIAAVPRTEGCRVILCSSLAATIGGRGQILYAVTNRMLDITARRLRAEGLDCVSIEWGLWSVAGPLDDAGFARVEGAGVYPMNAADAIEAGFTGQPTDSVILSADWTFVREILSAFGQDSVLADVPESPVETAVPANEPPSSSRHANDLPSSSRHAFGRDPHPEEATVASVDSGQKHAGMTGGTAYPTGSGGPGVNADAPLADRVLLELGHVMGIDTADTIDRSVPLVALGLDSLQALDFRKRVRSQLDRDLPVAAILGGASFDDVVLLMAENTN